MFYFMVRQLRNIVSAEDKIDKKGKPFTSFRFDWSDWHPFRLKSLVMYRDLEKGTIQLLANAGGTRRSTGKQFPIVKSYMLKPMKDPAYFAAYSGGKWAGKVSANEVQKFLKAGAKIDWFKDEPLIDYSDCF